MWRCSIWVILRALYATCCPYRRVRPQHMSAVPPSPLLSELVLPLSGGFRRPLMLQRIPSAHLTLVPLHSRAAAGVILPLHLQLWCVRISFASLDVHCEFTHCTALQLAQSDQVTAHFHISNAIYWGFLSSIGTFAYFVSQFSL